MPIQNPNRITLTLRAAGGQTLEPIQPFVQVGAHVSIGRGLAVIDLVQQPALGGELPAGLSWDQAPANAVALIGGKVDDLHPERKLFVWVPYTDRQTIGVLALPFDGRPAGSQQSAALDSPESVWVVLATRPAAQAVKLPPVDGDVLPGVGSTVLIHLASSDTWVPHNVVGYYVWGDLGGNDSLHRIFVRVRDADGHLNARLLKDVRKLNAPH